MNTTPYPIALPISTNTGSVTIPVVSYKSPRPITRGPYARKPAKRVRPRKGKK